VTLLDAVVVLVYLVGIAVIGVYQSVKIRSSGDYFAGGRRFSRWLMIMHALGTGTHADDPVGVAGAAKQHGIAGIWYTYVYLFATPFYWIMAPFFRRSRYITTADFFRDRFSPGLAVLYTVMGMLTFAVNTGTLLRGTGTIVTSVTQGRVPEWVGIGTMTVVFVAYGLAGGLVATVVTESIQGVLIVVMSLLLIPFGLAKIGGFGALHQLVDPSRFSLAATEEVTWQWAAGCTVAMIIGIVAQPHIMEVCSTGKTEFEGRVGFTYGNFVKRFCAMGWAFTGLIVTAMVAAGTLPELGQREDAFGVAIRELLPSGATGLMFAAILAAQMSTLSAFMVAGSALFSRNIYREYFRKDATDAEVLAVGRWAGLIVVLLGVVMAAAVRSVADALTIFWGLATLTGLFMWAGVLWRRTNAAGAWASFILMAVIWLALGKGGQLVARALGETAPVWLGMYADRGDMHRLLIAYLVPGTVVLVAVSLMTRPKPAAELDRFHTLISTPVGREGELERAGIETVYAGASDGHPWELDHPKLVNWVGFGLALAFCFVILAILWGLTRIGS